jgi:hypothetical protein
VHIAPESHIMLTLRAISAPARRQCFRAAPRVGATLSQASYQQCLLGRIEIRTNSTCRDSTPRGSPSSTARRLPAYVNLCWTACQAVSLRSMSRRKSLSSRSTRSTGMGDASVHCNNTTALAVQSGCRILMLCIGKLPRLPH